MNTQAVPRFAELTAPSSWRTADFISDLHLQAGEPATFDAWSRYMAETPADAVFILGDLFETWIGDDDARDPGFAAECAGVLQAAARRLPVFFMHGNRDFLVGSEFADACGLVLLPDPTVLSFAGERRVLTHGDALCLDDTEYLAFRARVRDPAWIAQFLAKPIAERRAMARALREESQARKGREEIYADVDALGAQHWLDVAGARLMIHGHTHRPAEHRLPGKGSRTVLSDWDLAADPPRAEALRVTAAGARRVPLA